MIRAAFVPLPLTGPDGFSGANPNLARLEEETAWVRARELAENLKDRLPGARNAANTWLRRALTSIKGSLALNRKGMTG